MFWNPHVERMLGGTRSTLKRGGLYLVSKEVKSLPAQLWERDILNRRTPYIFLAAVEIGTSMLQGGKHTSRNDLFTGCFHCSNELLSWFLVQTILFLLFFFLSSGFFATILLFKVSSEQWTFKIYGSNHPVFVEVSKGKWMVSAYVVPTVKNADKELIVVGCYAGNSIC